MRSCGAILVVLVGAFLLFVSQCTFNHTHGMSVPGAYAVLGGDVALGATHPHQLFRDAQGRCRLWVGNRLFSEDFRPLQTLPEDVLVRYPPTASRLRPVVDQGGELWMLHFDGEALRVGSSPEAARSAAPSLATTRAPVHAELRGEELWVALPERVVRVRRGDATGAPALVVETPGKEIRAAAVSQDGAVALGHDDSITLAGPGGARRELALPSERDRTVGLCFLGEGTLVVATGYRSWERSRLRVLDLGEVTPRWAGDTRLPFVWDRGKFFLAPSMVPGPEGSVLLLCAQDMEQRGSAALLRVHPRDLR
jgi:hypothetical protein